MRTAILTGCVLTPLLLCLQAKLEALGRARAPAPAPPAFMMGAETAEAAFPTLGQAVSGEAAAPAAAAQQGARLAGWGEGGSAAAAAGKRRKAKRRSRVQGGGWAEGGD